jgi:hypothetical protein
MFKYETIRKHGFYVYVLKLTEIGFLLSAVGEKGLPWVFTKKYFARVAYDRSKSE